MPVKTPGAATDVEYIGSWFSVELDKGITGFFTDASGLAIEIEVVETTDSTKTGDTRLRKRPGTAKYQDITLKRTLSPDKSFWTWAKSIRDGKPDYRSKGAIVLHDIAAGEIGRWTFENCWPQKWSVTDLDVGTDDIMTEEVTLAVEYLKRES